MPTLMTNPAAGLPPLPWNFGLSQPELRYQGAEALVYRTFFPVIPSGNASQLPARPAFLKHRPSKPYRHPILDTKLTRHRILAEARVLAKLRREGIAVPAIYALDWEAGWILGEWIEGPTIRTILHEMVPLWLKPGNAPSNNSVSCHISETVTRTATETALFKLMAQIGALVGKMHSVGVVHGDLTTSNLLLRTSKNSANNEGVSFTDCEGDVFLIDFGLVAQSIQDEDRAVDLYVLERAFGSSHPRTESLFNELLMAYEKSYKGAHITLKRLDEVRLRGRKKIMIG